MSNKTSQEQDRRAAIVCKHIALDGLPILRAVMDEPTLAVDSGWQFLCGSAESENPDEAKVWSIDEVLELEPSLRSYIANPPGTVLTRRDAISPWMVGTKRSKG